MSRTVVAVVDDLFWRTKIDHAARSAGAVAVFVADPAELASTDPGTTALVFVDLALRRLPFDGIAAIKTGERTRGIPVVGFYEHVRKDLKEKALAAGCDEVLSRSTFSERLADLVLRYALPGGVRTETEEPELPEE
jgi:CheY-like chemotaxis protein